MEPLAAQDPPRIGPFRLVAVLGRGGMGRVYLGRAESTGRAVALKTVHGELLADQEFRTRFTREVAAARQVRGDYIAQVVAADPHAAVPWLATAYVPGISVEEAVRRFGPLPADSVRVLGFCVARAVASIHEVGLVHRDLKPGNVLLTATGPKVIDFGIARGVAEEGLTRTGMVAGSPPYMAPEQLRTGDFGPPSDVFSLAAILHYAATAVGPYGRGGSQEIFARAVMHGPLLDDAVPTNLVPAIRAAMAIAPADRPDAAALGRQLEQYVGEQPGPGWLPGSVLQEILEQATAALSGESAAGGTMMLPPTMAAPSFVSPTVHAPSNGAGSGGSGPQAPSSPGSIPSGQAYPGPSSQGSIPHAAGPSAAPGTPPGGYLPPFGSGGGSGPQSRPDQQARNPYPPGAVPYTPPQPASQPAPRFPPAGRQPMPNPMQNPAQRPVHPRQQRPVMQNPYGVPMRQANPQGTAGLVLALVGIIMPCALPAGLVFSLVGLGKGRHGPYSRPRGAATAGLIVSVVLSVIWIVILLAVHAHDQAAGQASTY